MCKPILNYSIVVTRRITSTCYHQLLVKLPYKYTTYFLKISNHHHLLSRSPKIKCSNRPLVTYLKDINGTYFLISANGTVTPVSVLEDTAKPPSKPLEFMDMTTSYSPILLTNWNTTQCWRFSQTFTMPCKY